MKRNLLALICTILLFSVNAQDSWQDKIDMAMMKSFETQSDQLTPIIALLDSAEEWDSKRYWKAFACYRSTIYYLVAEDLEMAEKITTDGIEILESIEELDSEEHVLLATLLGLNITFRPEQAMALAMNSTKHFNEAVKLNDQNMRAYLGLGRSDFFTPIEYGGGQVVEKHLQKALSLPASSSDDPGAPSWGRDEAFMYLAMFYQREGRTAEGILTCKRGLKEFPEHSELSRILSELQKP